MSTPIQAQPTETPSGEGLSVTSKAAEWIRQLRNRESLGAHLLRISIVGGGCSGMSYRMGFVETEGEHDQVFEKDGVKVVVDPKSLLYLQGTTIDFADGLNGTGFTFNNPNAKRTCGCGSSFSA